MTNNDQLENKNHYFDNTTTKKTSFDVLDQTIFSICKFERFKSF
jgi:hypothetical protein